MKILSGYLHNRTIILPKDVDTRPTSSKVRAQVFNICQQSIHDAKFLDIFAGSGAMGFEAISRGAKGCTFIENDKKVLRALYENIERLQVADQCRIIPADAMKAISKLRSEEPFSLVFADPPYDFDKMALSSLMVEIDQDLPLENGAYLFLEVRKETFTPPALSTLQCEKSRRTGDTDLFVFRKI